MGTREQSVNLKSGFSVFEIIVGNGGDHDHHDNASDVIVRYTPGGGQQGGTIGD